MSKTIIQLAAAILVQAVVTVALYGFASQGQLARSPAIVYIPTAAAFGVHLVILLQPRMFSFRTPTRLAAVLAGAVTASGIGLFLGLLFSVNRWGA